MGTSGQRRAGQRTDGSAVASCRERAGRQRTARRRCSKPRSSGPEIRIENGAVIAVTGADLGARSMRQDIPLHRPVRCRPGSVLRFGERRSGARAYIAFGGGIAVPPVLGSRATHT